MNGLIEVERRYNLRTDPTFMPKINLVFVKCCARWGAGRRRRELIVPGAATSISWMQLLLEILSLIVMIKKLLLKTKGEPTE